jgi:hypothetical protein
VQDDRSADGQHDQVAASESNGEHNRSAHPSRSATAEPSGEDRGGQRQKS